MGAVNQLLASTGLQVSASNPNNNINNNNLPGSKLMARKRRNEYEDDEQYAGDKYIETDDMDDLEDDDYSMSEGEYQEEPDVSETNYDDYSSDDTGGYEDDYSSASESIDGELGLRSNEDTTTYQIATEAQQNMLNPTSNNMDMYIGTSNLYSDMVGLKPEMFRSESMENEFDANDYIGFNPENSILPSVTTDSIVGSFTTDEGIFSTFAPENENAFVPTLDGVFGFGGGESDESPFVPSVEGAIGLGLGVGIGSALSVPTTLRSGHTTRDLNPKREGLWIPYPNGNPQQPETKTPSNKAPTNTVITDTVVITSEVVSSTATETKRSESKTSKEDGDEDEKEDKKKEQSEKMQEYKDEMSEKRISQYERSARELMNKNEVSTNQYEAVSAAKRHSNEMADLRRQNQLAELQHTVAMRAKDKEMLDMMRNENIDSIKYNTEMQNRGQPFTTQTEMMPQPPYQGNDGIIGSGLDDILGVGNNYDSGFDMGVMGMSLGESLGVSSGFGGFGGMGSSLEESLGFVKYDDAPITMNASGMFDMKKWKDKATRGYRALKSGTQTAGNVISDVGNTLYNTRTAILNKTNPYREAYSQALKQKNEIKARELDAKQKLRDKQQEIRNANAMRAQEAREIRQARQLADVQHRIAMEAQRQELAQMKADAYDAQNMRNMMNDMSQALPNQGLNLGNNTSSMGLGLGGDAGGFSGLSLGVGNSVGGFGGMGLGDSLGLPSVRAQQPVQPQMAVAPTTPNVQYKTEAEKYPYSNSPRLTSSIEDDGFSYSGRGYRSTLFSEVMGEIKPMKKARKSTSKKTKKLNKNKVKRVKKVSKPKTR